MKNIMNGNLIKKIASGGDELIGRGHHEHEVSFVPHFIPFCMLNDIPLINPLDDAVYNRLKYIEFKKQFVENSTEDYHVKADPDIDIKFRDPKFIRGFTHLILDGFKYFLEHGQPEFDARTKEDWTIDGRQDTGVADILHNNFEITNNKNNFVSVADMKAFRNKYKKEFSSVSNKRFNEIVSLTFKLSQDRVGKNRVRGWSSLKKKEENYDMDD